MKDNPKPTHSTSSGDNPPVRMARTQEEMNPQAKPKRPYKKKKDGMKLSDEEWMKQMKNFVGVRATTPMTLEEIATVLGCTREWIRQIEAVAVKKLRRALELRGFMEFSDVFSDTHYSSGMMNSERYRED